MSKSQIKKMIFNVIMPPLLVIILFVVVIGAVIVPSTEKALMDKKRDMIQAIVMSATSIIERHAQMERDGIVTKDEAQKEALTELRVLRYGVGNNDYLWITDLEPRMVMHPFFPKLEGSLLTEYADPQGKLLFVEAAKIARNEGSGYIDYMWPKQDNIEKPVSKLSYIRLFEPWGWVVGSGVYLDDVHSEIGAVIIRLLQASAWIGLFILLLMLFIVWKGIKSETGRCKAETELLRSRARYQALAHASREMIFLTINGVIAGANKMACETLGFKEEEIISRKFSDFIADGSLTVLHNLEEPTGAIEPIEVVFNCISGPEQVLLSIESAIVNDSPAFLYSGYSLQYKDVPGKSFASYESLNLSGFGMVKLENRLNGKIVFADTVATEMITSSDNKTIVGKEFRTLVEEGDASRLFIQLQAEKYVHNMILRFSASQNITGYLQACATLIDESEGQEDQIIVFLTDVTAMQVLGKSSENLLSELLSPERKISIAAGLLEPVDIERNPLQYYMRTQTLLRQSVKMGLPAEKIVSAMTYTINDIFIKAIEKTILEIGPPPCGYALLSFGSIGRNEPTLNADQDTAILFESTSDDLRNQEYFYRFGESVTSISEASGISRCNGGNTAANPSWVMNEAAWRKQFSSWINTGQPEDLILVNIFFDFRVIAGDQKLAIDLRRHIFHEVHNRPAFLFNLAQDTLSYRPLFDLLGRIRSDSQHINYVNLKGTMMHFVNFARIYSLKNEIVETNTIKRLQALMEKKNIPQDTGQDTIEAWRFLLGLRLKNQVVSMELNFNQENTLILEELSSWEESMLKKAMSQIGNLQKRISSDTVKMS